MTKLEIVAKAFERNPRIVVLGPHEDKFFGEGWDGGLVHNAHTVHYMVAPRSGIYSISALNKWFRGLVPDYQSLKPVNNTPFVNERDGMVRLGHLRFDETGLGYTETLITRVERVNDESFLQGVKGFRDGMRVRTERMKAELGRVIMIYGCPDEGTALKSYRDCKKGKFSSYVRVSTNSISK